MANPMNPAMHILMMSLVFAAMIVPFLLVKTNRAGDWLDRLTVVLGWSIAAIWIAYNIYYFSPQVFNWSVSLPLHVCDILGPISAVALVARNKWAQSILAISAVPFAIQAVLTPTGVQDPSAPRFWLYWLLHAGILTAFTFNLFVYRFRPALHDLWFNFKLLTAYIAVILPLNILLDWNYGYIGQNKPGEVTALDLFGTWPLRIVPMVIIAMALQTIMFYLTKQRGGPDTVVSE